MADIVVVTETRVDVVTVTGSGKTDTVHVTGDAKVEVLTVGVQGPPGLDGLSSPATTTTLGGIIVGDNLSINANGLLSAQAGGVTAFNGRTGNVSLTANDLPVATNETLGGVIVGTGLTIANEVLSTQYTYLPTYLTTSNSTLWNNFPESFAIFRNSLTTYNGIQYGANTPSFGRLIVRGYSSTNVVGGPYSTTTNLPMFEIQLHSNGNPFYNPNGPPSFPTPISNAFRVRMVRSADSGLRTVVEIVGAKVFDDFWDATYNLSSTSVLTKSMGQVLYKPAASTSTIYVAPINLQDNTSMNKMMCDERYMRITLGGPRVG